MSKLSACIFEWDQSDVDLLVRAKKSELVMAGLTNLTPSAVHKAITKEDVCNSFKLPDPATSSIGPRER